MPAYSFKERFVPMVLDGTKSHTIRARRKKFAKPGDTLYLYYGMRTKHCRKLREETCTEVNTIIIQPDRGVYELDRRLNDIDIETKEGELIIDVPAVEYANAHLAPWQKDALAWCDGFRIDGSTKHNNKGCFELMFRFWQQTHGSTIFIGDIIYWDPK